MRRSVRRATFVVSFFLVFTLMIEAGPAQALPGHAYRISLPVSRWFSPLIGAVTGAARWVGREMASSASSSPPPADPGPGDLVSKRTPTSRTFQNANGSFTTEVFTYPVNFKDSNGLWQPIDNTLVAASRPGYRWQNKANSFRASLKDQTDRDMLALTVGNSTFTVGPDAESAPAASASPTPTSSTSASPTVSPTSSSSPAASASASNSPVASPSPSQSVPSSQPTQPSSSPGGGSASGNTASYASAFPATTADYRVEGDGVDETLLLHSAAAPSSFSYVLGGPVTSVSSLPDGSLLVKGPNAVPVLTLRAPWARDAAEMNVHAPMPAHATLSSAPVFGGYRITISLDQSWLHDPARVYPIMVDPSTHVFQSPGDGTRDAYFDYACPPGSTGDCVIQNSQPDEFVGTNDQIITRTSVQFTDIESTIPYYSIISNATLALWRDGCIANSNNTQSCSTHSEQVDAHRLTQGWGVSDTWKSMDTKWDSVIQASHTRAASDPYQNVWENYTVTNLVQQWVQAQFGDFGFYLIDHNESLGQGGPSYASTRNATTSNRPKLTVNWTINSTNGYPPAAPASAGVGAIGGGGVLASPTRSLLRAPNNGDLLLNDGASTFSFSNEPYSSFPNGSTAPQTTYDIYMDSAGNAYDLSFAGAPANPLVTKISHNGSSWTTGTGVSYADALGKVGTPRSIMKDSAGNLWVAHTEKNTQLQNHIFLYKSTDNGATWTKTSSQVPDDGTAELVAGGSTLGLLVKDSAANGELGWSSNADGFATVTYFGGDPAVTDSSFTFQAVATSSGQIVAVYSGDNGLGTRSRVFTPGSGWFPALGTPGTVIASSNGPIGVTTDGTNVIVVYGSGSAILDSTWNGAGWSSPLTLSLARVVSSPGPVQQIMVPQLVAANSVLPVAFIQQDASNGSTPWSFDYVDVAPASMIITPSSDAIINGTQTISATANDPGMIQRVDFMLDKGGGQLAFLGCNSAVGQAGCTNSNSFTYSWNTQDSDANGRKWPDGSYFVFARLWDYKALSGDSTPNVADIEALDLGIKSYHPNLPIAIGAGVSGNVNLYNGNLTINQATINDPSVLGSMSLPLAYNSQSTTTGKLGLGWDVAPKTSASFTFARLIDHSGDPVYPNNTVEIDEHDGKKHYYLLAGDRTYHSYVGDFSFLSKNFDGSACGLSGTSSPCWTLTLSDGTRYGFSTPSGSTYVPSSYRPAAPASDQNVFTYAYDAQFRLCALTDPAGRAIGLAYDANSHLSTITAGSASAGSCTVTATQPARTWTLTYTQLGSDFLLSDVRDPVNAVTTHYGYDSTTHKLTSVTTPAQVQAQFGYDTASPARISSVTDVHSGGADNSVTTISYDTANSRTKVIRPKGNLGSCNPTSCQPNYLTSYYYDTEGRLVRSELQLPGVSGLSSTRAVWNSQNLQTDAYDYVNNHTGYSYDGAGDLLSTTDPTGARVSHRYDEGYNGLQANYFNDSGGAHLVPPYVFRRLDSTVNFNWGTTGPGGGIGGSNYSVRWAGYVNASSVFPYTFYVGADDAARLYVDGRAVKLYDTAGNPVTTWPRSGPYVEWQSKPISLTGGLHAVTLEYYQLSGQAQVTLAWSAQDVSKQFIGITAADLDPGLGLETTVVNALGKTTKFSYDDAFLGKLTQSQTTNVPVSGPSQTLTTKYSYVGDPYGRITSVTMPGGNITGTPDPNYTTTYTYYGTSATAADTDCTNTSYPQLGLLQSVAKPGLAAVNVVHDGAGNAIESTNGKGHTCASHDALGRMTSMRAPDRTSATTYSWDPDGRLKGVADPTMPAASAYTYDDLGRLATAKDAMAPTTEAAVTYAYDEDNNLLSRTDKTGTTSYTPDTLDRIGSITDPAGASYSYNYDTDGRLKEQDLPANLKTTLAYDAASRVLQYNNLLGSNTISSYVTAYNLRGEKTYQDGPEGRWVYTYDTVGHLEQVHDPTTGRTRLYKFDPDSNRTELDLEQGWNKTANSFPPEPGTVVSTNQSVTASWFGDDALFNYSLKFTFPFLGQNYTKVCVSTSGFVALGTCPSSMPASSVDLFKQQPAGQRVSILAAYAREMIVDNPKTMPLTQTNITTKEPLNNQWVEIDWSTRTADTSQLVTAKLMIDQNGNIGIGPANPAAGGTAARIGVTSQDGLTFVATNCDRKPACSDTTYWLAPAAQSTASTYVYNALDQLTGGSVVGSTPSYSSDGELTSINYQDSRGSWTFSYDGRGLMKSETGNSGATTWTTDGEGRVAKEIAPASTTLFRYTAPGSAMAWEENTTGGITTSHVSGPLGAMATYSSGTPTFQLADNRGAIVQVANASGGVTTSYSYDEYGNPTNESTAATYGYAGTSLKRRDPATFVVRMGFRPYDPTLGRFLSSEPLAGVSLNDYVYADQDPINLQDLAGTAPEGEGVGGCGSGSACGAGWDGGSGTCSGACSSSSSGSSSTTSSGSQSSGSSKQGSSTTPNQVPLNGSGIPGIPGPPGSDPVGDVLHSCAQTDVPYLAPIAGLCGLIESVRNAIGDGRFIWDLFAGLIPDYWANHYMCACVNDSHWSID